MPRQSRNFLAAPSPSTKLVAVQADGLYEKYGSASAVVMFVAYLAEVNGASSGTVESVIKAAGNLKREES